MNNLHTYLHTEKKSVGTLTFSPLSLYIRALAGMSVSKGIKGFPSKDVRPYAMRYRP